MASYFHASPMDYFGISLRNTHSSSAPRTSIWKISPSFSNNVKKPAIFFSSQFGYSRFAYCYTLITELQGKRLFLRYLVANNGFSRRQL